MITAIETKNMKGQTVIQELTGMDILIGRNGAGKTTRVQALGFGMLGYVPGQKKTAADIFKMATGDCMTVGLRTDSFALNRTLTKSIKRDTKTGEQSVTIKESISISPGAGERTDNDKKIRIASELGNFPVMMDFSEFLAMSDSKRRDFVYSLSPIKSNSWNRERIHRYLADQLLTKELQENNPDQFEAMQGLIAKTIAEYPVGFGVSEGLQAMLDWVETEKKFWSSKQKDAQGAVRQISEQKNEIEETERGLIAKKQELEQLQNSLIKIEKDLSSSEEKQKAIDKKAARIAELTAAIAQIDNIPAVDTVEIDQQIATEKIKLKDVPMVDIAIADLKVKINNLRTQRKGLEEKARGVNSTISTIKTTISSLEDALNKVNELAGRCVMHHMVKCPKDFSDPVLIEGVKKNQTAADAKIAELQAEVDELNKQIADIDSQDAGCISQQSNLLKQVQDINTSNTAVNKVISNLTDKRNNLLKAAADRASKHTLYTNELVKLQNEPADEEIDIEPLKTQAADIRSKIADLQTVIDQKEKAKQALLIVQQSMIENRKAEYNAICLKLISDSLGAKGVQGELVKEILEPIRQDIGANLKLMGFEFEPYFQTESDTGKEIFQFGWINEKGHEVNFDALSTGQQTVFLAAMMVTIIDRAQPKLRVLVMDNLNHLDSINFQMLVNGLAQVKSKLDNIILAGAVEYEFAADGWHVWNLSPSIDEEPKSFLKDLKAFADSEVKESA